MFTSKMPETVTIGVNNFAISAEGKLKLPLGQDEMVALLRDDYAHHWEVGAEIDVDGVANQAADPKANLCLFYHVMK